MPPRVRKTAPKTPPPEEVDAALAVLETPEAAITPPPIDADDNVIPEALRFTTSDAPVEELTDADKVEFEIDGNILTAYRPSGGSWNVLLGGISAAATADHRTNAILEFVDHSCTAETQWYIRQRLHDRTNFDVDLLAKIVVGLIEHWAPGTPNRAARRAAARR